MDIRPIESARMQLRIRQGHLTPKSPTQSDRFIQGVRDLLADRETIGQAAKPPASPAGAVIREPRSKTTGSSSAKRMIRCGWQESGRSRPVPSPKRRISCGFLQATAPFFDLMLRPPRFLGGGER